MTTVGATPSRLSSLAELAGQPRDLNDPVTARYTAMLVETLDPEGVAARKAAEKDAEEKVITPSRTAMARIGVIGG